MRIGCFLILVAIALLWMGGQGLYIAVTNPKPQEYAVGQYLQTKPSSKWLRLTGGKLDLTSMNYTSFFGAGSITEIYVPLRPADASLHDEIHVLFATKDPALLQTAEKMRQVKTNDEILRFVQEHASELVIRKDVTGLIRFGVDLEDRQVRKLRKLNDNLAQDFIILEDGKRPEYAQSIFFFLGGAALTGWILWRVFGPSAPPPASQPPPIPPPGPGGVPPPLPNAR